MAEKVMFLTQRSKIMQAYQDAGQPFNASTKPYKSTVSFTFNAVNPIVAATVFWFVAPSGVPLTWFGYKLNDVVPSSGAQSLAGTTYRSANEADTNISKARTTNGAEDFVIEGMSASCRGVRMGLAGAAEIVDTSVASCLSGNLPILSLIHI